MSEKKKIRITSNGDFQGASVSTSSMGHSVHPKYINWMRESYMNDSARVVTDRDIKKYPGYGKIALLLEPYELHPENYLMAAASQYDYILTHHKEFVERYDRWLYYPFGGTFLAEEDWQIYPKENKVSMFITWKDTMPGHKLRHKVFHAFPDVEYYGRGFREVDNKLDGLKDFAFQIVIESSRARGYFTEKLLDCFLTGTVPIYWGDPDIEDHFDLRGIIQFTEMAELALALEEIKDNPGLLEMMQDAMKINFECAKKRVCAEDQIWWRHPGLFE